MNDLYSAYFTSHGALFIYTYANKNIVLKIKTFPSHPNPQNKMVHPVQTDFTNACHGDEAISNEGGGIML